MAENKAPKQVIEAAVKVDGNALKGDTFRIVRIRIDQQVNKIPVCTVVLCGGQVSGSNLDIVNDAKIAPGKSIEVEVGNDNALKSIFKGVIVDQTLRKEPGAGFVVHIKAKDKAVKMTLGRKNATFLKKKDQAIIQSLIEDAGLEADVGKTETKHEQMLQYWATDWDFMLARAEANGLTVQVANGKVCVKEPGKSDDDPVDAKLEGNVLDLDLQVSAQHQYAKVTAASWNVKKQEVDTANATPTDSGAGDLTTKQLSAVLGVAEIHLASGGFVEKGDLTTWCKGLGAKSAYSKLQGSIDIVGTEAVKAGGKLKIAGFGSHYDGTAWVGGVTHRIGDGNWVTTCHLGMPAEPISEELRMDAPGASGQLPGVQGLHVGKVKKIHEDEAGNFRVQVALPLLQAESPLIWARFATFYASNGVGALFYPELEDEVVVGFFGGDPRYPVILGSMYSSTVAPTDAPAEENPLKQIVSKEKLKIMFDDENKVLTVITPGENKLIFSDDEESILMQDQHENKVEMTKEGITIQTSKKLTLKGEKEVEILGKEIKISGDSKVAIDSKEVSAKGSSKVDVKGANVSIKGDSKVDIKGAKVAIAGDATLEAKGAQTTIKGDAKLELKGGAQATLQGGAMCEVKGALVKIN